MNMGHQWYKRLSVLLVGVLLTLTLCVNPGWGAEEAINATTYDSAPGASVVYTGSWTHSSGWNKAYSSTVSYSNQNGAKVKLTFTGRYITRVYTMASNRGSAKIYIDGVLKSTTNDSSSSARWQVAKTWDTGSYGQHTIEVVNDGGYIDSDAFIVDITTSGDGVHDNTASQLKYIGNWTSATGWGGAHAGTLSWDATSEDAVTFTFIGNSVTYIYTRANNRGYAAVTIDGIDRGVVDLYSDVPLFQQGKNYSGLGSGPHTIHVTVTPNRNVQSLGNYIDVDAFKVGELYNRNNAVSYADTWAHGRNLVYPVFGTGCVCDDCTNFVSQVLEAGGIPQIRNLTPTNQGSWYVIGTTTNSHSWSATDWFKSHVDSNNARYQYVGDNSVFVESLTAGDFVVMNLLSNPYPGADHASAIVGRGKPSEGDQMGQDGLLLRNAHCCDRKRVRWNYGLISGDVTYAYRVIY